MEYRNIVDATKELKFPGQEFVLSSQIASETDLFYIPKLTGLQETLCQTLLNRQFRTVTASDSTELPSIPTLGLRSVEDASDPAIADVRSTSTKFIHARVLASSSAIKGTLSTRLSSFHWSNAFNYIGKSFDLE